MADVAYRVDRFGRVRPLPDENAKPVASDIQLRVFHNEYATTHVTYVLHKGCSGLRERYWRSHILDVGTFDRFPISSRWRAWCGHIRHHRGVIAATAAVTDFTRQRMRETSLMQLIVPPIPLETEQEHDES